MAKRTKRIGIFDSGFGGLHVLRHIASALPQYEYVYLGDTARAPYGGRSQETIYNFTKQAVDFLFRQKCAVVIVACHTASSKALRKLQDEYVEKHGSGKKALGVLIPATEEALERTRSRSIGVIATKSTVASRKFARELTRFDSKMRVFQRACPLLVPLIEAGRQDSEETKTILEKYIRPLLHKKIDTLVLGCTHYGILERKIRAIVGPDVAIVSEAKVVPKKLKTYLKKHGDIEKTLGKRSGVRFYSTDGTDNFKRLGSKLFGRAIEAKRAILN